MPTPRASRLSARAPALVAAALFLALFAFLLFAAPPSLYWGDSAEYTTLACTLGVGHSPGYPLMTMLARLAAALPLDSFPLRTHHISLFFSALAAAAFFLFLFHLTDSLFPAAAGAALFAFGRAFVSNSLFAEAYALHFFLFTSALLCLALHDKTRRIHHLLLGLALIFAGLAHHYLMLFAFLGAAAYLLLLPGRAWRAAGAALLLLFAMYALAMFRSYDVMKNLQFLLWFGIIGGWALLAFYLVYLAFDTAALRPALRAMLPVAFLLSAGLFIFIFLPLASAREPGADWWNPETFRRFANLLLLKGYSATLPGGLISLLKRLRIEEALRQAPAAFLVAAVPGMVVLALRKTRLFAALLVIFLANAAGALMIEHGKPDALRLPLFAIVAAFSAAWLAWLLSLRLFKGAAWRRALSVPIYAGAVVMLAATAASLGGLTMNRDDNAYRLGAGMASSTADRSILFIGVQSPSIMDYFESCENRFLGEKRAAIIPVSFLSFTWKMEQLRRRYLWLDFPPFAPGDDEADLFKVRTEPRVEYAAALLTRNPSLTGVFSDFIFLPPELNLAPVPAGYLYRMLPADLITSPEIFARADFHPRWSAVRDMSALSRANVSSVINERGNVYMQYGISTADPVAARAAVREFDRAIRVKKDYPEPYANKGAALFFLGDAAGAVALQRKAVRLAPDRAELHDQLATTQFRRQTRDSVQDAIRHWAAAILLDPKNARYHHNLATVFVAIQNLPAAINSYQRAIELNPRYLEAYINLARVNLSLENCAGAVSNAEAARNLAPDRQEVRAELIDIYFQCRMRRLFDMELEDFIKTFPHDLDFYHNLGIIYRNIGQIEPAVRAYREAAKLDPAYQLTDMFQSLTGCDEAIAPMREAARLVPEDPGIRMLLASKLYLCGRPDDTRRVLLDAARAFPSNPGIRAMLKQLDAEQNPPQP